MGYFLPFYPPPPLTVWKMKISIKQKKALGHIIILHKCTKNHDHMLYCSSDMAHDTCNCYFSFWASFCPFIPLTDQKIKISREKKKKKTWYIITLHMCTWFIHEILSFYTYHHFIHIYGFWDMVRDGRTDRRMNGRTEKVTYRSGCLEIDNQY